MFKRDIIKEKSWKSIASNRISFCDGWSGRVSSIQVGLAGGLLTEDMGEYTLALLDKGNGKVRAELRTRVQG